MPPHLVDCNTPENVFKDLITPAPQATLNTGAPARSNQRGRGKRAGAVDNEKYAAPGTNPPASACQPKVRPPSLFSNHDFHNMNVLEALYQDLVVYAAQVSDKYALLFNPVISAGTSITCFLTLGWIKPQSANASQIDTNFFALPATYAWFVCSTSSP